MRWIFNSVVALLIQISLLSQPAFAAVSVLSQWAMPTRFNHPWELRPYERTKPLVVGDVLYVANLDGVVSAIHRTQGYVLWTKKMEGPVEGAFVYGRSKLFVGDTKGNLVALQTRDGSEAWRFKVSAEFLSAPLIMKDKVFVGTSNDELYALQENTGKELWHFQHRGDEKMTTRGTSGPAGFGTEIVQGFSDGYVALLSSIDGKVKWQRKLRTKDRFYDVDATPYIDENRVIAATFDGKIYSLDKKQGDIQWTFPAGSYGGLLVHQERLFFAGLDSNFYSISVKDRSVLWKRPMKRGVGTAPIMVGSHLVVNSSNDPVYVLDPATGDVAWEGNLGTGTLSAPSGNEGWFFCMSNYGNLFSFEIRPDLKTRRPFQIIPTPSAI